MKEHILQVLEKDINPVLDQHHGHATLVSVQEGQVVIRLGGTCSTCPDARNTFESVVRKTLQNKIPGIKGITLDESVEDEMVSIAKYILSTHKVPKT